MKAREIKKLTLKRHKEAIEDYNIARTRLEALHTKVRELEIDLKQYFDINVTHNFE